ncbi:hypothetical protein [Pantoea sp. Fr+CA_20]|uniref:RipA family octameric membrane protein n=1 Tax=Pantoea TaxID=53335 RepID=UPI002119578F|nr:hypothetical protein [Pantoea sp. Fr+CA_20]
MKEEKNWAFDHAWKYFELHSQQRMTVFNFYVAAIGLLAAGSGICLQQGGKFIYLIPLIGLGIIFITFIFYKLDYRVSSLIKKSESALKLLEKELLDPALKIFTNEYNENYISKDTLSIWTYGKCFRVTFYVLANVGLLLITTPLVIYLFE